jgi:hypothetical protein
MDTKKSFDNLSKFNNQHNFFGGDRGCGYITVIEYKNLHFDYE